MYIPYIEAPIVRRVTAIPQFIRNFSDLVTSQFEKKALARPAPDMVNAVSNEP